MGWGQFYRYRTLDLFVTEADGDEKQQQEHRQLFPPRSINLLLPGAALFNMELWGFASSISHSSERQSLQNALMAACIHNKWRRINASSASKM